MVIAYAVVAIAVLYIAKVVVLPLALAILFAFLVSPLVGRLEKFKIPRTLSICMVILAVFALISAISWGVVTQLIEISDELPAYRANIETKIGEIHHTKTTRLSRIEGELKQISQELGLTHPASSKAAETEPMGSPQRPLTVQQASSGNGLLNTVPDVIRYAVEALLVVVFGFFMLLEREDLRNRMIRLMGRGDLGVKTQAINETSRRISRYFAFLLAVNAAYGFVIFVALHFLGLPHAWLFGVLTTLLRFVPYIGAPISALLPILMALVFFRGWERALVILGIFLVVELVTANYIEPRLYGKHTGLSPLAILVAAVFWTLIWGPVGLILSVPLTVCLIVLGEHVPNLRFLGVLLGDQPALPPWAQFYQRLLAFDEEEAGDVLEAYLKQQPIEDLYDSVLLPALGSAEVERHENKLDDDTVGFIHQTTRDLVEELSSRSDDRTKIASALLQNGARTETADDASGQNGHPQLAKMVVCIPVRDKADETAAIMLAQLLERAGSHAQALPLSGMEDVLAEVSRIRPDTVFLSALPPFAISPARAAHRKLRLRNPKMEILVGLWNYAGSPSDAGRKIGGDGAEPVFVTMGQALLRLGAAAEVDRSSLAEPAMDIP